MAQGQMKKDVLEAGDHVEDIFWQDDHREEIQDMPYGLVVFEGTASWEGDPEPDLILCGSFRKASDIEALRLARGEMIWDKDVGESE